MRLCLMVSNPDELSGGCSAVGNFDESGGTIGAGADNDWQINDSSGAVAGRQLIVSCQDGGFCLTTAAPKTVRLNGGSAFLPANEPVRITDGDVFQIGRLSLGAFIEFSAEEAGSRADKGKSWARRFISVSNLIEPREEEEDIISDNFLSQRRAAGALALIRRRAHSEAMQSKDPIHIIETEYGSRTTDERDPVRLIDREEQAEKDLMEDTLGDIIQIAPEKAGRTEIPDDLQPGSAFMDIPERGMMMADKAETANAAAPAENRRSEDIDSYLEHLSETARAAPETSGEKLRAIAARDRYLGAVETAAGDEQPLIDHVLLRPLCAALGLPVQKMTVPQADRLMQDIGAALRTAISGIIEIYQKAMDRQSHVAETHLHAIEDNPLRLDKTLDDVLADLFLVKSPVHLSAAAAIEESLKQIEYHQEASESAADEALAMVLRALDPVALAKRFRRYKGHRPEAENSDAWRWEMYQSYYQEIRSERQGGLSRMFWEVYRQVYDREMRAKALEG